MIQQLKSWKNISNSSSSFPPLLRRQGRRQKARGSQPDRAPKEAKDRRRGMVIHAEAVQVIELAVYLTRGEFSAIRASLELSVRRKISGCERQRARYVWLMRTQKLRNVLRQDRAAPSCLNYHTVMYLQRKRDTERRARTSSAEPA